MTLALGDSAAMDALDNRANEFRALVADINLGQGVTGFDVARAAPASSTAPSR